MSQLDVEQKVENKKMNSCRAACLVYKMCSKSRFQHSCINGITELVFHMKKNVFIQSSEFNLYFFKKKKSKSNMQFYFISCKLTVRFSQSEITNVILVLLLAIFIIN